MARDVLRGPDLAAGVLAVAVLPDVVDGERVGSLAGEDVLAEEAPDHVVVDGQAILREDGVAELLELLEDLVVDAGVVVIRTAEQDDAETVFALELVQHFAGGAAHGHVVEVVEGAIALLDGALVLFGREAEDVLELLKHLALEEVGLGQIDERIQEDGCPFP